MNSIRKSSFRIRWPFT